MPVRSRIYLGRLSYRATQREVERFFKGYGKIVDVQLKNGYGFVDFDNPRDAEDAVYDLNGKDLCGERVIVELAKGTPHGRDLERDRGYSRGGRDRGGDRRSRSRSRSPPPRRRSRSPRRSSRRSRSRSPPPANRASADRGKRRNDSRSPSPPARDQRSRSRSRSGSPRSGGNDNGNGNVANSNGRRDSDDGRSGSEHGDD